MAECRVSKVTFWLNNLLQTLASVALELKTLILMESFHRIICFTLTNLVMYNIVEHHFSVST